MYPLNGAQREALSSPHYGSHLRLYVETESGDLENLTSYVDRVTWGGSIDEPILQFSAEMILSDTAEQRSLSPLFPEKVLDLWRIVRLDVATVPELATPRDTDWARVFAGRIDHVDFAADPLVFTATGPQPALGTLFVKEEKTYVEEGKEASLISVVNRVLDDWGGGARLHVPQAPEAGIDGEFVVTEQSVIRAIQNIVGAIGWVIITTYPEGAPRLTLVRPQRHGAPVLWTFGPEDYDEVSRLDLDIENIRNVIRVDWVDTGGEERSLEKPNDVSRQRYGEQWGAFIEGDDSGIRTLAQAQQLLDDALADLSLPHAEQEITTKLFWPVEVEDVYQFQPNGVHYTERQRWAVVAYEHEISNETDTSRLIVRGQPSGSYTVWRGRETDPRGGETLPFGQVEIHPRSAGIDPGRIQVHLTASGNRHAQSFRAAASLDGFPTTPDVMFNRKSVEDQRIAQLNAPGMGPAPPPDAYTGQVYVSVWFYAGPNGTGARGPIIRTAALNTTFWIG